jgi:type 1 glutamine amidotransferase
MKRTLLIGDNEKAQYHPLKAISKELTQLLKDITDIEVSEDYELLRNEHIGEFDLCILYVDRWGEDLDENLMDGIIDFVDQGKALLIIHNGIAFQSNKRFINLIGGEFTGHPEHTIFQIRATENGERLYNYASSFEIDEEPYRFILSDNIKREITLEYVHEGQVYPAGWSIDYNGSKVAYLMPGHELKSFKNEDYREIIKRTVTAML